MICLADCENVNKYKTDINMPWLVSLKSIIDAYPNTRT